MATSPSETLLISRSCAGEPDAWNEFIARYEGRLLGFVARRVANQAAAEDLVQETFVGFLNSLPNYDPEQPLEGYLFSIAAHKLTDLLRHEGRRPAMPLMTGKAATTGTVGRGRAPAASSAAANGMAWKNRPGHAIGEMIVHWRRRGQWERLQCIELLWVRGWSNKEVAARLGISEQIVANYKFETIARLRTAISGQGLPEEVFPELYQ